MEINEVLDKVKKITETKTKKELAEILGISPPDFSQRERRGTLLPLILDWAIENNINLEYLFRGKKELIVNSQNVVNGNTILQANNGTVKVIQRIGDTQAKVMTEEQSLKAMRLLTKIMASGNATLINIAMSQLVTLAQAVDEEKKETL